jgi:hypothetical protein
MLFLFVGVRGRGPSLGLGGGLLGWPCRIPFSSDIVEEFAYLIERIEVKVDKIYLET